MTRTTIVRPADASLRSAVRLALVFAVFKLFIHIVATLWQRHIGVGYFRDEFYYLMCGRHLAWGYVDHGPLVAVQARIAETVFGHSLLGIRILSAAAGSMRVILAGLLCWSLGGRRSAQALAMAGVTSVPLYLGIDGFLSMNSFESMFWLLCVLALIMIFRDASEGTDRRWMWWSLAGSSAGLGLLNKPSMAFFLIAVVAALLLTPQRRVLFTRQAAYGLALMLVIVLPNLLWQIQNHFPTLEFLHNGRVEGKNIRLSPLAFMLNQFVVIGPWNALVWIPGLVHLWRRPDRRWLGLAFLILLGLMIALGAKDYYFAPIYPILFAAGGVAWQARFARRASVRRDSAFAFGGAIATMLVGAAVVFPSTAPVLQPQTFWRYSRTLHLPDTETENGARAALPQFFADRYGWQENVNEITRIVNSLSPEDRARVGIFCGNYGEAASLEWLGHGLPTVISEHNNYWLWGTRGLDGEVIIIDRKTTVDKLRKYYEEVQVVGHVDHPLSMPYERHDIFLARHRKMPLAPDWAESKFYY